MASLTGDIPQNVNFAINVNVLRSFLDANCVDYDTASSGKTLPPRRLQTRPRALRCWWSVGSK
jgi:hypothetical protein